jgi:hypothetical protein
MTICHVSCLISCFECHVEKTKLNPLKYDCVHGLMNVSNKYKWRCLEQIKPR